MVKGIFKSMFYKDSIRDFYPVAKLVVNDEASLFSEKNFFSEGLNFRIKLGDINEVPFFEHVFYWSEAKLQDVTSNRNPAGALIMNLISNFQQQGFSKARSFFMNISDIVRQVTSAYIYPLGAPIQIITPTVNQDTWYQGNITDKAFIKKLEKVSFAPSFPNSGFVSFFNLAGEFYFVAVDQLLNQPPIATLRYNVSDSPVGLGITPAEEIAKSVSKYNFSEFSFFGAGAPTNMKNYSKIFYATDSTGITTPLPAPLVSRFIPKGPLKLPILKSRSQLGPTEMHDFGIIDGPGQINMYKGWQNRQLQDTLAFPYVMPIKTIFNPLLVSGKTVKIMIQSSDITRGKVAYEYSGNWVILESVHAVNHEGVAGTSVLLGKNALNIHPTHPFYVDFIP